MKNYKPVMKASRSSVRIIKTYNPKYEEAHPNEHCACGHSYYRHFDLYETTPSMSCKYCGCGNYVPCDEVYDKNGLEAFRVFLLTLNIEQVTIDIVGENKDSEVLEILFQIRRGYAKHFLYNFHEIQIDQCIEWLEANDISSKKVDVELPPKRFRRGRLSMRNSREKLSFEQFSDFSANTYHDD